MLASCSVVSCESLPLEVVRRQVHDQPRRKASFVARAAHSQLQTVQAVQDVPCTEEDVRQQVGGLIILHMLQHVGC